MVDESSIKLVEEIVTNLDDNYASEESDEKKPYDLIIVGGGRVGAHLIEKLKTCPRYNVTLIDDNAENMKSLKEKYEEINFIIGNATEKKTLEKAGIETADIIVAATSVDEINLLISITAQKYNLNKIIARTTDPSHIKMFKKLGVSEVVSPELAACSDIEKMIVPQNISEIAVMGKGDFELIDVPVKANRIAGKCICDISPNKNFIIVLCHKNDETFIAQNNIVLEKGDLVSVLVRTKYIKKTRKFFTKNNILPI
jgi:trk system potassium uptake protein TrkA